MTKRTAPFTQIKEQPLTTISAWAGIVIRRQVELPGLIRRGGGPVTVDVTYTVEEIADDWVSVIVDHQYDSDPQIYGNHPLAVGTLRDLLPEAYPLPSFPRRRRVSRNKIVDVLMMLGCGGTVAPRRGSCAVDIHLPNLPSDQVDSYLSTVNEYLPFDALAWADLAKGVIHIQPRKDCDD
jgi:hypothetical protein